MKPFRWSFIAAALAISACGVTGPSPLRQSMWGGEHIELRVMTTSATVEFDCAHGTITEAFTVDRNGRFDALGTFVRERGGPIRGGEAPDTHPARYAGVTNGNAMTLTVTLTDQSETVGSFMLVLGTPGRLVKCL